MADHFYKKVVLLIIVSALFFVFHYFKSNKPDEIEEGPTVSISEKRQYWEKQIEKLEPENAYVKFKDTYKNLVASEAHAMAHLFGQVLYAKLGNAGIAICDGMYGYGCYHGLFNSSIEVNGENSIKDFADACFEKFGIHDPGCQHGVGHIILYLKKYDLQSALAVCNTLQGAPDNGCLGGVFMEYSGRNLKEPGIDENIPPRPGDIDHPYVPCLELDKSFRTACFYQLTDWWVEKLHLDFPAMGNLCLKLDGNDRISCLRGTGKSAVWTSEYDLDKTLVKCNLMPDQFTKNWCKIGASWTFFGESIYQHLADEICKNLKPEDRNQCAHNRIQDSEN